MAAKKVFKGFPQAAYQEDDLFDEVFSANGAGPTEELRRSKKNFTIQPVKDGAVTAYTFDLEGSIDGVNFDVLGTFDQTNDKKLVFILDKPVLFVRLNMVSSTLGGQNVTVKLLVKE